jgi:hypothetical protein
MRMTAYCGIDCAKCPAFRYPRLGEKLHMRGLFQRMLKSGRERARRRQMLEARSQNAEVRSQEPKAKTPEEAGYIICDGCVTIDARCLASCLVCPVRCCAMEMGVVNCAHCARFPCERLTVVWERTRFKDAKPRLEKLRSGLKR